MFVFGFTCHQNLFAVHNELSQNTLSRVHTVITASVFSGFAVYAVLSIFAYLTFGADIKDNIVMMYPAGPFITFGQVSIGGVIS